MIYPVVLCGGHGTRLWPVSRENFPKQFIRFTGKLSLLQNTVKRIKSLPSIHAPYILTNHTQRFLVEEQLGAIGVESAEIILEPEARGTAPAVTLAAINLSKVSSDAVMLVLSSDNEITHPVRFRRILQGASKLAKQKNKFLLFSSRPSYPETGYGYIKCGSVLAAHRSGVQIFQIDKFIEKPSLIEATACIQDGFQWNSGIFMLPVKLYLQEMEMYAPRILEACLKASDATHAPRHRGQTSGYYINHINAKEFEQCPEDSIDYALMEKTINAAVVETNIGWSDVGSWSSLYTVQKKDSDGNVIKANSCISINNRNVQVYSASPERMVAAVNLQNITIVDSENAVLVLDTAHSQDVKKVVNNIKLDKSTKFLAKALYHKDWGKYEVIMQEKRFVLKRLTIKEGQSYTHKGSDKSKHFMVLEGAVKIFFNNGTQYCKANRSIIVPANTPYKVRNMSKLQESVLLKMEF